jgi:protein SCO1/2
MKTTPARLWPTLCACAAVLGLFLWAGCTLTRSFEQWRFESLRQEDAARGLLATSSVAITTAAGERRRLWAGGARDPVYLLDFIYTSCPTLCQALGSEFAQMQAQIVAEPEGSPRLLSLSFDPEHDRADELAAYARLHGADARVWTVAAPLAREELDALLSRLGVVVVPDGAGGYLHNGAILLVDARGSVRGVFELAQWREALAAARSLAGGAS